MADGIPARLIRAEGRSFGLSVGIAFVLLAAVMLWRERPTLAVVFGGLGGTLVLAGLVVPAHIGPVRNAWMRFAYATSKVTSPIMLGIAYYLVIVPTGLVMRVVGRKPLSHRLHGNSYWVGRSSGPGSDMRRQF